MELSDQELYDWIFKVNSLFYDKVYDDEWFKAVFRNIGKEIIIRQQTDFIVGAFGGPKRFSGKLPQDAHPHIFVDEEMWQVREQFLIAACKELNAPEGMLDKWLKIDNAFKKAIIKNSEADCKKRYFSDEIIIEKKPLNKKAG